MSEPFLGQLMAVPYNFAPNGWAFCEGQFLPISEYTALFSLLGTTYGGDGTTNFALPDLRGRVPIGVGQGPGLSNFELGEVGGAETTTAVPAHTHTLPANAGLATTDAPAGAVPAGGGAYAAATDGTQLAATGDTGTTPVSIQSPYLTISWVIALTGIYPSRN
jgi:microcystin-dependent protein